MARRKQSAPVELAPNEARYILNRLLAERRVNASDVEQVLAEGRQVIVELEARLTKLRDMVGGAAPERSTPMPPAKQIVESAPVEVRKPPRKRAAMTPERLASMQLQGRYIGLLRKIPESRRGKFAKLAKEKGREVALREMKKVVKG